MQKAVQVQQGQQLGMSGEQAQKAKEPRAPPSLLQPTTATMARFMEMDLKLPEPGEAATAMETLESFKGLAVFAVEGDGKAEGKRLAELGPGFKVTYGKLIYKGNGCHFSVGCQTPEGLQKLGPMQFLKVANNSSSRPRNVIFICCNGQSVADFEKDHAIPLDPVLLDAKNSRRERRAEEDGEDEKVKVPREPPKCGPGATYSEWPEDDTHICEEDHRCCDVARFYGVDLDVLVDKNKYRWDTFLTYTHVHIYVSIQMYM